MAAAALAARYRTEFGGDGGDLRGERPWAGQAVQIDRAGQVRGLRRVEQLVVLEPHDLVAAPGVVEPDDVAQLMRRDIGDVRRARIAVHPRLPRQLQVEADRGPGDRGDRAGGAHVALDIGEGDAAGFLLPADQQVGRRRVARRHELHIGGRRPRHHRVADPGGEIGGADSRVGQAVADRYQRAAVDRRVARDLTCHEGVGDDGPLPEARRAPLDAPALQLEKDEFRIGIGGRRHDRAHPLNGRGRRRQGGLHRLHRAQLAGGQHTRGYHGARTDER